MTDKAFWQGKKVLITGHTGFKGAWLCIWLNYLGANLTGYALGPPTQPSLFEICRLERQVRSLTGDIRNQALLEKTMQEVRPEIVLHLAAQSLVRESYLNPVDTYEVNVIGSAALFEAVRKCSSIRAVVNVTTDKCYLNREWPWGYRENDILGGFDPYSSSKACAELVTDAFRNSFFNPGEYHLHGVAIASARAGNVIGGGDWARDRLIPDCVRALSREEKAVIRNPGAARPWQHVLEPLGGYLKLARKLYEHGPCFGEAWNFGPEDRDAKPVEWVVQRFCAKWGPDASYEADEKNSLPEAGCLKLDCSKARARLDWYPRWDLDQAIGKVVEWTLAYRAGADPGELCLRQIREYSSGR